MPRSSIHAPTLFDAPILQKTGAASAMQKAAEKRSLNARSPIEKPHDL
jgi:hypothetical protein